MILRTVFSCKACAPRSVYPRIVIDSEASERFTILGCPICASGDLQVDSIEPVDVQPTPQTAPPPASPGAPANDTRAAAVAPAPATPAIAPPPGVVPPRLAASVEDATARKADFVQLPSRVQCADCDAVLTFPVTEPMTAALARSGWKAVPPRGVQCPAHEAKESTASA